MDKKKQQQPKSKSCGQAQPKQQKPKATAAPIASKACSREASPPCAPPLSRVPSAPSGTNLRANEDAAGPAANCQKRFKHLIHKHQIKNEQLERREDHLLRRLEMLQCSMPVMLAQVCQQPEALLQLLERQFSSGGDDADGDNACVRATPSRHYDCRVREIEAQRKEACRRAEEARALWREREQALRDQKARVELARQQQQERKQRVQQLSDEARQLQQKQSKVLGKKDWLTESEASLGSNDLECLRQLESLVESESCRRRHLSELEAQNEMYMRVFARAEQIRSSSQDDELNKQLEACRAELAKYKDVKRSDAAVGMANAKLCNKNAQAVPKCVSRAQSSARLQSPKPTRTEQACEAQVQAQSKVTWTSSSKTATKDVEARVECAPACVGRVYSEANKSVLAKPKACDKKSQAKTNVTTLALGPDVSQLDEPSRCECGSDKQRETPCPPNPAGNKPPDPKANEEKRPCKKKSSTKSSCNTDSDKNMLRIPRSEIQSCMSIVNDMHEKLAGSPKFPHVCKDFQNLKNIFASALGLDYNKLEKQVGEKGTSKTKQPECEGVTFVGKGEKEQQLHVSTAITCECGPDGALMMGRQQKKIDKDWATTPKCKSEKGGQTDDVDAMICKCEPVEQKDQAVACKTEKPKQICDRGVSTDKKDKTLREAKATLTDRVVEPPCKGEQKKQKCDAEVSTYIGDDIARQCKEQKRKCNDIVAALANNCEKGKQAVNIKAPAIRCKSPKNKDDVAKKIEKDKAKCPDACATGKEERRKLKDDAALCKGEKIKLSDSKTALTTKKDKAKTKPADATLTGKASNGKSEYANNALVTKGKKQESGPGARIGISDPKERAKSPIVAKKEPISKVKTLCCDDKIATSKKAKPLKNDQQQPSRKCDSKTKLGSGSAQPCGSDKKLTIACEDKKNMKTALKSPCKIDEKPARQCQNKEKKSAAEQNKVTSVCKKPIISLRPLKVPSQKSVKQLEKDKSKQSIKSGTKSLSRKDPTTKKEAGSDEGRAATSTENLEESSKHQSNDKQTPKTRVPDEKKKAELTEVKEVRSNEGSEYFECFCEPSTGCGGVSPAEAAKDKPVDDKKPLEELCICQPLCKIVDKWQEGAAPGKFYCGNPPDKTRREWHRRVQTYQRRRPRARARRRHHPYKRALSSTCLGRPKIDAKCGCSGVSIAPSPSVCQLTDKRATSPGGCRRCGAAIPFIQSPASLRSSLLADQDQADSQENHTDNANSETTCHAGKRDQGVLAKLPKPKKAESKRKKREQLENPVEGLSGRKVAQMVEVISSAECTMPARLVVGPSCTCLKNHCHCPDF